MHHHDYVGLKLGVLRHLRQLLHERAATREILPLDLTTVAADLRVSEQVIQGVIAELMYLAYVRPTGSADEHFAITLGECEISAAGIDYLNGVETEVWLSAEGPQFRRAGFRLGDDE